MPCSSQHMEPTGIEKALSEVRYLQDELNGKIVRPEQFRSGTHPTVYGCSPKQEDLDLATRILCEDLQLVDVTQYSLEMQIWWRDHQTHDRKRIVDAATNAVLCKYLQGDHVFAHKVVNSVCGKLYDLGLLKEKG